MIESWWTTSPETGEAVEVMPAERVVDALTGAQEAEVRADVFREYAARVRVMLRALDAPDSTPGSQATALERVRAAIDHMAKGMPRQAAATNQNEEKS